MTEYELGRIRILLELGPYDDSSFEIVVKARDIPLGLGTGTGQIGISVKEASNANQVEYWPPITMLEPNRRERISEVADRILTKAKESKCTKIGFFTMGLEVARIPSWEIAEELIKAIYQHSKDENHINEIFLVAASPTQISSFQYALDNVALISGEDEQSHI